MILTAFFVGVFVGIFIGMMVFALLSMNRLNDDDTQQ